MTNEDSVFREVEQAMAEDRQSELFRKNGPLLIGFGAAIVLSVAGWQIWQAQKNARAAETAADFALAVETLSTQPEDGRAALEQIGREGPAGYAALARMRLAGSLASSGEREAALRVFREVYGDSRAPRRLRELARLRAASLSLEDGRSEALGDLGGLADSDSIFRHYALELSALAALDAKDYATAQGMFERAAADPDAPEPVRLRAEEFGALAAAGAAGVNLSGQATVDDLLDALDTGAGDSHEGHEHDEVVGDQLGEEDGLANSSPETQDEAGDEDETPEAAPDGADVEQDQLSNEN